MKKIQVSNKDELMTELDSLGDTVETVYINTRPSVEIVNRILKTAPNIKRILCPPSLLKQTSTKAFEVLDQAGVELGQHDVKVGRPAKYSEGIIEEILERKEQGMSVKDISKQMDIPIRTTYYYLKNNQP